MEFVEFVYSKSGSVESMYPKESVEGAHTVLRGSVRPPEGFSESKPKAAKPRGHGPQGFAAEGFPEENPEGALTLPRSTQHSVGTQGTLLRGQFFHTAPRIFNSCSDYQNHEVHVRLTFPLSKV